MVIDQGWQSFWAHSLHSLITSRYTASKSNAALLYSFHFLKTFTVYLFDEEEDHDCHDDIEYRTE